MPAWFDTPSGKDTHGQIAVLQDGRVIAYGKNYKYSDQLFHGETQACEVINVRVPDLRLIEYVLNVQFTYQPIDCTKNIFQAVNKKIMGNVVGMTIFGTEGTAVGSTLTVEVIAIGPP